MAFMFASLPSNDRIPPSLIENCARLAAEWQLYVVHTRALRKIFLSIKGVYYQAEVNDQTVTWLVPYQFTQSVRMTAPLCRSVSNSITDTCGCRRSCDADIP
jgi:pescadillo protein